jgi:hypothetical protein
MAGRSGRQSFNMTEFHERFGVIKLQEEKASRRQRFKKTKLQKDISSKR